LKKNRGKFFNKSCSNTKIKEETGVNCSIKDPSKIGLRHPNLKAQQEMVKSYQGIQNRPKKPQTTLQKTHRGYPTNRSGLNNVTDQ
jgi:hypothetical protein